MLSYRIQVYCASMVYSDESATYGHIKMRDNEKTTKKSTSQLSLHLNSRLS